MIPPDPPTPQGMTLDEAVVFLAANLEAHPGTRPAWARSPLALKVLLAGAFHLPEFRRIADAAFDEHRATHPNVEPSQCEQCGYFMAAKYDAQTGGRSLAADFLDTPAPVARPTPGPEGPA